MPDEYNLMAFGKETVTFGRDDTNDIMIASDIVSRRHGHFTVSDGRCYIADDNSTNGIYVNGKRIKQAELKDGDSIRIDDMECSLRRRTTAGLLISAHSIVSERMPITSARSV